MQSDNRPLSPFMHYKQGWTGGPSIVHRVTGAGLTLGSLLLVWWLVALATGPEAFASAQAVLTSLFGKVILFGLSWALIYHTMAGIRHLVWDFGCGFEVPKAKRAAQFVVFGSIVLTLVLWVVAYAI